MNASNYAQYDFAPYIRKLQLSLNAQRRAENILLHAQQAGLAARKTPESLIAAALYIACILERKDERRVKLVKLPAFRLTRFKFGISSLCMTLEFSRLHRKQRIAFKQALVVFVTSFSR